MGHCRRHHARLGESCSRFRNENGNSLEHGRRSARLHARKLRLAGPFPSPHAACELNLIKPMAEIYEYTLEKLNVRADEALFIDDRLENVEGARAVGMHSLLFRGVPHLHEDLQREVSPANCRRCPPSKFTPSCRLSWSLLQLQQPATARSMMVFPSELEPAPQFQH